MNVGKYRHRWFGIVLGIGALVAFALCTQCVRTFLYIDSALIPQAAEREAERQGGALGAAARSAGIAGPHSLGPLIQHALKSSPHRVLWIRVLDLNSRVIVQGDRCRCLK